MKKQIEIVYSGAEVRSTRQASIVAGSVESTYAKFIFDNMWDKYTKTAIFIAGDVIIRVVLDETCICKVPWEVLTEPGFLVIGVIGQYETEVFPSLKANFVISEGFSSEGNVSEEPTPDLYDQITKYMADTYAVASSLRADAEAGKFKGEKGEKGPQGERGETGPQGEKGDKGDSYTLTEDDKKEIAKMSRTEIAVDGETLVFSEAMGATVDNDCLVI